jgi:cytoskeletal protein CcmA (bactofilin family)
VSLSLQNIVARLTGNTPRDYSVKLVPGIELEGHLACAGKVEILADCHCSVTTAGVFVLHEEAAMSMPVKAEQARIEGRMEAALEVSGELELMAASRFRGTAKTGSLRIAPGAEADMQLELGPMVESSKFDSPIIAIRPTARSESPRKRVEIDLGNL